MSIPLLSFVLLCLCFVFLLPLPLSSDLHLWSSILLLSFDVNAVSRTQDLINQIKQISTEICDIKTRNKIKINSLMEGIIQESSTNAHNHIQYDPLQICHETHDEDDEHYDHSIQSIHLVPDNMNNLECCALSGPLCAETTPGNDSSLRVTNRFLSSLPLLTETTMNH